MVPVDAVVETASGQPGSRTRVIIQGLGKSTDRISISVGVFVVDKPTQSLQTHWGETRQE